MHNQGPMGPLKLPPGSYKTDVSQGKRTAVIGRGVSDKYFATQRS